MEDNTIVKFRVEQDFVLQCLTRARENHERQTVLEACTALQYISDLPSFYGEGSTDLVKEKIRHLYSNHNYHEFVREILSSPDVSANPDVVKTLYVTFMKIVHPLAQKDLQEKIYTQEFMKFFVICFVQFTGSFKHLIFVIVRTMMWYVSNSKTIENIRVLKELHFHKSIVDLLKECSTLESICVTMKLLALLIDQYVKIKDTKTFLEIRVQYLILDKAQFLAFNLQFFNSFNHVLLSLTADKELSLQLFEDGYLERLLEVFDQKSMLGMRESVIRAIGNLALRGQHVRQVLLDMEFYNSLLSILDLEVDTADPSLIGACCRVLCILASGDWVKRRYMERGCAAALLKIIRCPHLKGEVLWRALRLLGILGSMTVIDRQFILTSEVLEEVVSILQTADCDRVINYSTQVLLRGNKLDPGARKLRELGVVETTRALIGRPCYAEAQSLRKYVLELTEKLNLYTLVLPSNVKLAIYPDRHPSDWPPPLKVKVSSAMSMGSSLSGITLPPFDGSCFQPSTPVAPELSDSARCQLKRLGLNPEKLLFRVGRLYGNSFGQCKNCSCKLSSDELVIRPLSMTVDQYQCLVDRGWNRRGGVKLYRLLHNHNAECCDWETRVLVKEFDHTKHKSFKKVLRRMPVEHLTVETCHAHFSKEAFDLYNNYHIKKHDKPLKSEYAYCEHVVNTPTTYQVINGVEYGTFHQMYRLDGKLVAVEVVDVIPKGIVSVYMWYDVSREVAKYSFGVYSVLKDIEMVRAMSERNPQMEYYYLQGWNNNNKKLSYKADYEPEEFYCPCIVTNWVPGLDAVELSILTMERNLSAETSGKNASISVPFQHIEACAFPLDAKRYKEDTGKDLDISKMVVCLNYTKFVYLEELLESYMTDDCQREMIATRFKELYVSVGAELSRQLVVDMMASQRNVVNCMTFESTSSIVSPQNESYLCDIST